MNHRMTRRDCLKSSAAAAAVFTILPAGLARGYAANEKVNVGIIGSGGRGGANLKGVAELGENIVALCDVDRGHLDGAARGFPDAKTYTDFRELLTREKGLDAVVVSTPDHCHAAASVMAMKLGLHCYCEKPLTWSVHEARVMAETAAEKKLSTHMGTPSRGGEGTVRTVEVVRGGAIGQVKEVHFWTNRPIWPQGFDRPEGEDPVPDSLDWDLWIGPAPMRPFKATWPEGHPVYQSKWNHRQVYHSFVWRGWWDFGTGALGDIAPHMWSPAYCGLELDAPQSVEVVETSGPVTEMFPAATTIRFNFPARGDRPAVPVYWYDGGNRPSSELAGMENVPDGGMLIVGDKATLGTGNRSASGAEFDTVPKTLRRYGTMYEEWVAGIKEGDPDRPSCPFSYAGPLTEAYLLGNIALKLDRKIEWNAKTMRITNCEEANQYLHREYREGWEL
ncbi:MAG: Gfo/Idh/MocA family oxidoreductase [Planctomycetota bacterium]